MVFTVSANTNAVATIELFSTGGVIGVLTNQASGSFSVPGAYLGEGLHPFYAIVTTTNGTQYRTETKWIRLVTLGPSFPLTGSGSPLQFSWPAVAGRSYDILSADSLTNTFQVRASVVPTNDFGQWVEIESNQASRFYRVRSGP